MVGLAPAIWLEFWRACWPAGPIALDAQIEMGHALGDFCAVIARSQL